MKTITDNISSENKKIILHKLADFLYEAEALSSINRSGFSFTKINIEQSVAEHTNATAFIALALWYLATELGQTVNREKMLLMAMFHDFEETRTSDLHHVNQKYVKGKNHLVNQDQIKNLPKALQIIFQATITEYEARESLESLLVKDADCLELAMKLSNKKSSDLMAKDMYANTISRLKTDAGKLLLSAIEKTTDYAWWHNDLY